MNETRASIALAAYNGELYIKEQLDSILQMLTNKDEIIISYDSSTDRTLEIIKFYEQKDSRIKIFMNNKFSGVNGNFTNAIENCSGRYIFMSDQDDIWIGNKIEKMIELLESNKADIGIHNGEIVNEDLTSTGETFFSFIKPKTDPISNFYKGRFWGCSICFKNNLKEIILPFPNKPKDIPHDIYLVVLAGLFKRKIVLSEDIFILHRIHANNVTPKNSRKIIKIFLDRVNLIISLFTRIIELIL